MRLALVILAFVTGIGALPLTPARAADDPRRAQIQAAHADAIAALVDEVKVLRLTPDLTVGQFLDRTGGEDQLRRIIERNAEQLGATRWPNPGTCQVQLEVSSNEVARTLITIAEDAPRKTPLPSEALARRLEAAWKARTFAATGTSASPEALERVRPGPEQPLWMSVPEEDRRAAVKAAQRNAARRAVDGLAEVRVGDGKTVADALQVPAVRDAIQDWVATRPVTNIEFRDNGEVRVSVSAPGEELWTVFRDALARQNDIPAPRDEAAWQRLHDEVVVHLRSPVGGRYTVTSRQFTPGSRPATRVSLPAQPPAWVDEQADAEGTAAGGGPRRLLVSNSAQADALRNLRSQIELLPLGDGRRLGDLAAQDPQVSAAIDRALLRARVRRADWGADGSDVKVYVALDLRHVWQELVRRSTAAEFYKTEGRLATEQALLDDNADALGTPADWFRGTRATRSAKDGAPLDGARAHQWHLVLSPAEQALPADLRAKRDQLELEIESLRAKKASLPEAQYYARLEPLLVQLARLYDAGAAAPAPR
jgi:hypothetical protein